MRKLMMAAVIVMGMSLGYSPAEAKDSQKVKVAQTQPRTQEGATDAEINEAHRMNKDYDARKAARAEAKTNEVMGNIQSVSGNALTIRIPSKSNRKMDFKADSQSKVMKDSQSAALSDLKEGDQVRVSYQIVGKERMVVSVDAHKAGSGTPPPTKKP